MRPSKRHLVLSLAAITIASLLGAWAYQVYHTYTVMKPASIAAKKTFILNPANQPAILSACQTMLANPAAYPQAPGDAFPSKLPPALSSLGATSITIEPTGVLIFFEGGFGLWAIPAGAAPNLPFPGATPLIPGLWLVPYGNRP